MGTGVRPCLHRRRKRRRLHGVIRRLRLRHVVVVWSLLAADCLCHLGLGGILLGGGIGLPRGGGGLRAGAYTRPLLSST